uniref:Uncharacterized protein n=1 Tax=Vitis vinifera TaxID=29760 RepID=A5B3I3_VITVI|nr:hypothetical protein VITISV_027035 [Vitis vinifera]
MSNPISYMYFTWLDEIDAANDEYHSLIMNDICNVVASMASESSNQPTEDGDGDGEENEDEDGEEDEDGDEDGEEDENEYEDEDMALVDEYWMQQVVHATMTSIKELEKMSNPIGHIYSIWWSNIDALNDELLSPNVFCIEFCARDMVVHHNLEEEDGDDLTLYVDECDLVAPKITFVIQRVAQEYHSRIMNDIYEVATYIASEPSNIGSL